MTLHTQQQRIDRLKTLGYYNGNLDSSTIVFKAVNGLTPRALYGPVTDALLFDDNTKGNTAVPPWMFPAFELLGLREYSGSRHNAKILEFWKTLQLPFHDDETAWCAGFTGYCLEKAGIRSTRSALARSYAQYGVAVKPRFGAIATFWRGSRNSGSGHVAFVAGADAQGGVLILGGNQGDSVSVVRADKSRLLGYRFPQGYTRLAPFLPTIANIAQLSVKEG